MHIFEMKLLKILIIGLFALASAACAHRDATQERVIAVSIEPMRWALEQIVGDHYKVVALMPSGADPEAFEPAVSARADFDRASLFFTIGYLPFEQKMIETTSVRAVATTGNITPIYGTHKCHHHGDHSHGDAADPHLWISIANMKAIAEAMCNEICTLDPDNTEEYKANLQELTHTLTEADAEIRADLDGCASRAFMLWHPTLSYFARDYSLEQIAVCADNKDVTPATMQTAIEKARSKSVRVFFSQGYCDPRQAQTLADETGAQIISVNLSGYDWLDQMKAVSRGLAQH